MSLTKALIPAVFYQFVVSFPVYYVISLLKEDSQKKKPTTGKTALDPHVISHKQQVTYINVERLISMIQMT